ncbi:MAG: DUF2459 domain-containing protein [Verrucomicrobiales bacterium]
MEYPSVMRSVLKKCLGLGLFTSFVLACLLVLNACQPWHVTAPAQVHKPALVFLSEYNKHTKVAFPQPDSTYVEFGFGEWHYYGCEDHSVGSALRAVVGGGRGALSRRVVKPLSPSESAFVQAANATRSTALPVEHELMAQTLASLEARWQASEEIVFRADGVEVRSDPEAYHTLKNSNAVSANWLKKMGVQVRGAPVWSNYRLVSQQE